MGKQRQQVAPHELLAVWQRTREVTLPIPAYKRGDTVRCYAPQFGCVECSIGVVVRLFDGTAYYGVESTVRKQERVKYRLNRHSFRTMPFKEQMLVDKKAYLKTGELVRVRADERGLFYYGPSRRLPVFKTFVREDEVLDKL